MAKTRKPKLSDYQKKLLDPRWQKRRLEILDSAGWKCQWCSDTRKTLHVHHGYYRRAADPWDYDDQYFHVLCDPCHKRAELERGDLYRVIGMVPPSVMAGLHELTVTYAAACLPKLVEERSLAPSEPEPERDPSLDEEADMEELENFFNGLKDFLGDK